MNPMKVTRTTNDMKANVSTTAREIEIAPRITTIPIVIAVGRVGRLECFREGTSDIVGDDVGVDRAAGIGGTDNGRVGVADEDVGVMKVDGTDGSVVLVLFPDCEIVIVVGGIPADVVVFVLL